LPSKFCINLKYGDVFRLEVPGGGGWGDPLARDPASVLRDARNGLVSLAAARVDYGVVIDAAWTVEAAATETLRAEMKARRAPLPAITRERAA
jgi:N-methylhydantoinase B